jgi:hypothetical protein
MRRGSKVEPLPGDRDQSYQEMGRRAKTSKQLFAAKSRHIYYEEMPPLFLQQMTAAARNISVRFFDWPQQ